MPIAAASASQSAADDRHGYLPIEQHAAIGDRRTAAMVGADGIIDWLCLPNYDNGVVFGALLDAGRGGHWKLGPDGPWLGEQQYLDDTAVLRTCWSTPDWELELVDAMTWPERDESDRNESKRIVLRKLHCMRGSVACAMDLLPRATFGAPIALNTPYARDTTADGGRSLMCWISRPEAYGPLQASSCWRFDLKEGDSLWAVFGEGEEPDSWSADRAQAVLEETIASWSSWAQRHPFFGPRRGAVSRSVVTIRMLGFQPTGAQVAAPTCSLPEKIGAGRNYDYRFAWVRDASLALAILAVMGDMTAAERYMDWLAKLDSTNEMPLQVIYRIDGSCDITQSERQDLEGYRGSRPVRFGNDAFQQFQLDSLGYLADCSLIYLEQGGPWKPEYWDMIERMAEFTVGNWQREDNGIWELSKRRHYVSSKVMSWVVLERACRIADKLPSAEAPAHWKSAMDAIVAEVMERGWSPSQQAFRQHYDTDELDASVLLMATMGFMAADHPQMLSTIAAIRSQLEQDCLVWRFHPRSQGYPELPLDGMEGAFLPCTFWLASVLARAGQPDEAEKILDRVDAAFGRLGLYPEEIDPKTDSALGNMPLVFSHAEHLKAVMDYAKAKPFAHMLLASGMMVRKVLRIAGKA
jgi:GH15 family glucan-1,4-alpha-glucosidase